jgi:predicted  nucleic acid-binding Zn-ribbon protein
MIETEIHDLLAAPAGGVGAPPLARIEDALTAGYAQALALEAERWRIERRITEVASELDGGATETSELRKLGRSLKKANGDLSNLRALLVSLRERASQIRTAAA